MAAFDWLELQTLTGDIAEARSRLAAARANRDDRHVRFLEQEIAAAEARRSRLLAVLTDQLAGQVHENPNPDAAPPSTAREDDDGRSTVVELTRYAADARPSEGRSATPLRQLGLADNRKGSLVMWEQLTPRDIDRARSELDRRRNEVLARHAEELKCLEADREQLASFENAVAEFLRRFGNAEDGVIALDEERELRAAG